jgi:hypothetical protein
MCSTPNVSASLGNLGILNYRTVLRVRYEIYTSVST